MNNKVYYGEYSLKHWVDLILKKNIQLPPYQRYFVWNENKVRNLIDTFKKKQFVPPVTIGAFKINDVNQNLVIDGQQRLTSILLAYLGLFPDETTYKKAIEQFANENDDDNEIEQLDSILEWKFDKLTEKGNNKKDILSKIHNEYKVINMEITDDFLEKMYLGFSYIVPQMQDEGQQQKFYSSVFRNINNQGEPLSSQESRESLYFLGNNLAQFFNPDFCKNFTINNRSSETKLDFIRYLSLLSQYHKDMKIYNVAKYYSGKGKMEAYYEEYIYSIVGEDKSEMFANFSTVFPDRKYDAKFNLLQNAINSLKFPKPFPSIIDCDMYLFGLVYEIIFEKKAIDNTKEDNIKKELEDKIAKSKKDYSHTKTPSALKHLRLRIEESIEIYRKYCK
ncbi:hypothetical protein AGMMS4956_13300 [Bacteroidia bacterium]|nr:hypothetical protein AGMMS4956_13300 [Bacteroidia bacterium]